MPQQVQPMPVPFDPALCATIVRRTPMRYADGADRATDRPAHVRAASGIARVGGRIVVAQDDANFLALVDPRTGLADSVLLPAGPGGRRQFDDSRGNKRHKLDLESITVLPVRDGEADGGLVAAFGSGSSPERERAVLWDPAAPDAVRVVRLPHLYALLRNAPEFAGAELNVEGIIVVGGVARLFGRGNGAARDGHDPVNATCELPLDALLAHLADPSRPAPAPERVVQFDLGRLDDCPIGFTDAVVVEDAAPAATRVLYTGSAEDSPDATRDGDVTGSVIGVIETQGGSTRARQTRVLDETGAPVREKIEGIALGDRSSRLLVVVDQDRPDAPSELWELELGGFGA